MPIILAFLEETVSRLASVSDTPELDARVLLANILDKSRTWIEAHPETHPTQSQLAAAKKAIARLEAGEPLPYVLGHWEFFGLALEITPDGAHANPELQAKAPGFLGGMPHGFPPFVRPCRVAWP